ncbi:hypothetical protein [Rhodanobacter sp. MP1X3]|uniref:hypothetical protein n=1 Tax=Rhodanobacter sp. MP1X3 TaxID=2723086 RepID=UPI00161234A8|nr:hypothetical protein [Rhodanobacter sp. MP1X3]MBB6244271.1 hypothetical protein [Rhodanobacter sp. MP1X3]
MTTQLHPNFYRCVTWVFSAILVLATIGYLWQGYGEGDWWTRDYIFSMLIPIAIAPLAVWLMFVPSQLEFSDSQIIIKFRFRPLYELSWSNLKYYGSGQSVFMIQFVGYGTFQIFPQAFHRSDWLLLKNFLSSTFPEKKASGYIGNRMFKWPRPKV